MAESRVFSELRGNPARSGAGIVSRIRLENFMCHSSLQIELGDWVNFITGQNGSGKSAILTALCVAFGCRAKGTQRASTLKDFIKTGCNYAAVQVEVKNQGEDAFKWETYGDIIIIERRITETSSTITLKNFQGKKVASRRDELRELVEYFNIDVENPCVIMSQDKSREFLHSGTDKDKFKFFFKATLLQQVSELLLSIRGQLDAADAIVVELESSIRPILKELNELRDKIKSMEHVEEIAQELQNTKKRLAWCWVYDVDRQIEEQKTKILTLKDRIPTCQARIDKHMAKVEELNEVLITRKDLVASLMEKSSKVREMKVEVQNKLSSSVKESMELEEEYSRGSNVLQKMCRSASMIEQKIHDIQEQYHKDSQANESEIEDRLMKLKDEISVAQAIILSMQDDEKKISENLTVTRNDLEKISEEIEESEKKFGELNSYVHDLQRRRTNKVTAFGGDRVLRLLQVIERHQRKFHQPPVGPIGAHVTLVNGDIWALAVECAIGKLLDAFVVTNYKDLHLLRACAHEANYKNVQILIYDFSRPRLHIPNNMLPTSNHPTLLSVVHAVNHTIMNVLVDLGSVERQVLVRDYEMGKHVAFEQRIQNLKDVYTSDGFRMFYRGSVQTTLPPPRWLKSGRLCGSIDEQLWQVEKEATSFQQHLQEGKGKKRQFERSIKDFESSLDIAKRRRLVEERHLRAKQIALEDIRVTCAADRNADAAPNVEELLGEIADMQEKIQEKQLALEKLKVRMTIAGGKSNDLKKSFESLHDSVKEDINAIEGAERELLSIQEDLRSSKAEGAHYERIMNSKVLPDIKNAERLLEELQDKRQDYFSKASVICQESDMEALGGCHGKTPEQLSSRISKLKQRLQHESQRYTLSVEDLRAMYEKKEKKILRKQQTYEVFREKMHACKKALDLRWNKFLRNATLLKRQLTWQFNGHLRKKGISGHIKIDYDEKTLSLEVKMPQDASGSTVRDTKGLSGGERSFSTLCFALALHEMTEAPFRAMDEFDVFMDAVSRKISLDTLVDFAAAQGSQWIFITPHDISMVKPGDRIKKQQMAAPRS